MLQKIIKNQNKRKHRTRKKCTLFVPAFVFRFSVEREKEGQRRGEERPRGEMGEVEMNGWFGHVREFLDIFSGSVK